MIKQPVSQMLFQCSGQPEGYGGGDAWGGQTPRTQLSGSAMERNVARLFRDRVKFTAAVEFTQASILAGFFDATSHIATILPIAESLTCCRLPYAGLVVCQP